MIFRDGRIFGGFGGLKVGFLAAASAALLAPLCSIAYGDAVVGSGTSASCSEAALSAALAVGGDISFDCGGPATITVTSVKTIL